jgi:hypothetical protein
MSSLIHTWGSDAAGLALVPACLHRHRTRIHIRLSDKPQMVPCNVLGAGAESSAGVILRPPQIRVNWHCYGRVMRTLRLG